MSNRMTEDEIEAAKHLLWVEGHRYAGIPPGSFTTALIGAMQRADLQNLHKLLSAFPEFRPAVDIMHNEGAGSLIGALEHG